MKHSYGNEQLRFSKKADRSNEVDNFYNWFDEQIQLYGQELTYYTYGVSLTGYDPVYGEQPSASYGSAKTVVMFVELNESSIMLSKFGIQPDDDVTAFVTISSFYSGVSSEAVPRPEPKSGDVFTLSEYGDDRPEGRGGKSFEITQRLDQEISKINPLMGHYVWMINAKRLEYTFNPGLSAEPKSDQVTDSNFSGRLSGYTNPKTDNKVDTTNDVDTQAKTVWDYDTSGDDDVYGDYY
tara:strand:- start:150 stop:863 length:714 start_codon:yes stop_codon:yes gene_type:complete